MSELNGVALADRAVRHLGIEIANTQIALATQNARLEEMAEAASHVDFQLWDEILIPQIDTSHEGPVPPPPPPQAARYSVPMYQVEAVARLLSLLQPR